MKGYREVEHERQREFWRVGRVFMVLWPKPARAVRGVEGSTASQNHYTTISCEVEYIVEFAGSWFLQDMARHLQVSPLPVTKLKVLYSFTFRPIETYNNQGTLKPNLPEPLAHAIIFTSIEAPSPLPIDGIDGIVIHENLILSPVRVDREQRGHEGDIGIYSRINYSKNYTVDKNICVMNIGLVHRDSMQTLEQNAYLHSPFLKPEGSARPRRSEGRGKKSK